MAVGFESITLSPSAPTSQLRASTWVTAGATEPKGDAIATDRSAEPRTAAASHTEEATGATATTTATVAITAGSATATPMAATTATGASAAAPRRRAMAVVGTRPTTGVAAATRGARPAARAPIAAEVAEDGTTMPQPLTRALLTRATARTRAGKALAAYKLGRLQLRLRLFLSLLGRGSQIRKVLKRMVNVRVAKVFVKA